MYLDKSTFTRYREELEQFSPEDFHIGPIEKSHKAQGTKRKCPLNTSRV